MTSSSRPSSNCAQRGAALGLLLASMLLALSILAASIVAAGWPLRIRVVSPRLGMPTIDKPGATLEVRIVSSLPFILPTLAMSLAGPGPQGKVAPLQITQRRWDGVNAVFTMLLPEVPDGGYTLQVRTKSQTVLLPKAIFLRHEWPAVLHLAHIADLPPPGGEALMRRFVEEMQQKKPDAVLVTGDINYTGAESNIQFMQAQLARLDAPVIMTAGNHEREGWHRYLRVFGARDHRTNFGPLVVLSLDSAHGRDALTPSAFRWLRLQLTQLSGRTPLIQLHHPLFPPGPKATSEAGGTGGYLRGYRRAFLDLCEQYHVAMVLSGHWHQDAVFDSQGNFRTDRSDFPGTKYVVTTALGAEVRKVFEQSPVRNGYRWIEFANGKLVSYSSDPRNPVPSTLLEAPVRAP